MKQLIIIGAGGFGREVLGWASQCAEYRRDWEIAGFLDDNPDAIAGFNLGVPLLGAIREHQPAADECFICAIAEPELKKQCTSAISSKGGSFTRIIHPSVLIGERVELAEGVILCPRATLTCDIRMGRHCALNLFTAIGHDVCLGDFCQMHSYSELCGHVCLEDGVLVGSHASVLPGRRVGSHATVGAGSIVTRDVPAGVSVFGQPAQVIWKQKG